jgi:hypothetical protein
MGEFITGQALPVVFFSRCKRCGKDSDDIIHTRWVPDTCDYGSDGSTLIRYVADVTYIDDDGEEHVTPKGTESDGSSNPPITWPLLGHPFKSTRLKSSGWHDSQYQCAPPTDATIWRAVRSETRNKVDDKYREMMADEGEPKKELVYWGVRKGGWWAWYRHAKRNAEGLTNG